MDLSVSALFDFLRSYTDTHRLLSLRLDSGSPSADTLLVGRLSGTETLSECYAFTVECYTPDASVRADALLGRRIGVALNGAAGGERWFNGVVTKVTPREADGGLARFDLTVTPHLALLGVGRVARTYQELSVPDILDAELARWQQAIPDLKWRFNLNGSYPIRSYTVFHQESALAALQRLTAEEGIGFYFEHLPAAGDDVGQQVIVFFDDVSALPANAQAEQRFHRADATEATDSIDRWDIERQITPGAVSLQAWEYKGVSSLAAEMPSAELPPAAAWMQSLIDYAPLTQNYGSGSGDLERYARLRMEAHEASASPVRGEGAVRSSLPGTVFTLLNHHSVRPDDNRFVFVSVEHDARNNLPPDLLKQIGGTAGAAEAGVEAGYRNRFTATRQSKPWRPPFDASRHVRPTAPGPQPAVVVGPPGQEIHTDDLGRVQVRFPWDAEARNTCWLRVVTPLAGNGWGHIHLPRIGQEVLVDFVQNDIDRPVIIGCLYDGTHKPPRFSDAGGYPANHALSGYKSSELRGTGYGELLFDDTTGQTKTKLSSEHGKTQLNQGWIGHPRSEGSSSPRGQGFELRTDLNGAIRAAQGLLLSADPRPGAKGATLDRQELIGQLETALSLAKQLAELTTTHEAGGTDTAAQSDLLSAIKGWEDKASGGPQVVAVSGPGGIVMSSPKSVQATAGTNFDVTAAQDVNISTGRKLMLRAAQGLSAFAHKAGIQLIAAAGKLNLQAHSGEVEIGAAKRLHQYSLDSILIEAPKILLKTAGAQIALTESGITLSTAGQIKGQASGYDFSGGGGGGISLPGMPTSSMKTNERVALAGRGGQAREAVAYEIRDAKDAVVDAGKSTADGATQAVVSDVEMKPLFMSLKP